MQRFMTAILTATPLVTCVRITERSESARGVSSSTPLLIGPGCMMNAPFLRRFSRRRFSPKTLAYSETDGKCVAL